MSQSQRLSTMVGIASRDEDDFGGESQGTVWPLNAVLVLLGAAILAVAFYFLDPQEPRILHNPWTYAIATPLAVLLFSLLLSTVVSRVVEKSMQLAFLLSVLVHLLLLVYAVNIVIFSRVWPDVLDSLAAERQQLRREALQANQYHVLSSNNKTSKRPDHMRIVPTEHQPTEIEKATSPAIQLARSERLDLITPSPKHLPTASPHLLQREQSATTTPTSSENAASLSRSEPSPMERPLSPPDLSPRQAAPQPEPSLQASEATTRRRRNQETVLQPSPAAPEPSRVATAAAVRRASAEPPLAASRLPSPALPARGSTEPMAPRGSTAVEAPSMASADADGTPGASDSVENVRVEAGAGELRRSSQRGSRGAGSALPPSQQAQSGTNPPSSSIARAGLPSGAQRATGLAAEADVSRSTQTPAASPTRTIGRTGTPGPTRPPGSASGAPATGLVDVPDSANPVAGQGESDLGGLQASGNLARSRSSSSSALPSPSPLEIEAMAGPGGVSPVPEMTGPLLPRRRDSDTPAATPPQIDSQRFARQEVGGPLAAGRDVAMPTPAFQQRLERLEDREARDETAIEPQTEQAIERGLVFLAKHQRPDGSWRLQDFDTPVLMRSDTAATGLALLAFQGAGYTHKQYKYADTVGRAIKFLAKHQSSNGDLFIPQDPASNQNAWLYSHGIAALAVCEAYGMTQDPELRPLAQKSIDFMVASQDKQHGGWRYRPGSGTDTSVTGWFMMAFKSGQLAGLEVSDEAFARIEGYLRESQVSPAEPHLYRYNPFALDTPQQRHGLRPTAAMTSVGLLMRLYFGWQRDKPEMIDGADYLLENMPQHGTRAVSLRDTYYWYYATQVMFHMGGEHWEEWHDKLYPLLIRNQVTQGENEGSWDPMLPTPDLWARYGGRLYVTTMNLLSLEVSYRHLPLYEATGPL